MEQAAGTPVRIFSSKEFVPDGTMFMDLFAPFWGPNDVTLDSMQPTRTVRYVEKHADFLALSSLEACDFVVFPVEYQVCTGPVREPYLLRLAELARQAGKPLVVFIGGDRNQHPPVGDFVLHTALYRSSLHRNTFCMPPMLEDLAGRYLDGKVPTRDKVPVPSVSFCGAAPPLGMPFGRKWLKEQLRGLAYRAGLLKGLKVGYAPRVLSVKALRRARGIESNIVIRPHGFVQFCWGHLVAVDESGDLIATEPFADYRKEYVNNLIGSDYVLCVRGLGNYSLRLYECLCVGRIPIIVDTDMVFPFEDQIDWKSVGIWVEEAELPRLEEKILEFHQRQTDDSFRGLQRRSREIWEEFVSPEGFYAHAFRGLAR